MNVEELLISENVIADLIGTQSPSFPKYTATIINQANVWSQATRPKNVGKVAQLFPEFRDENLHGGVAEWEGWYEERYPGVIDTATQKTWVMVQKVVAAAQMINESMVRRWIRDLIVNKTYNGLSVQKAILDRMARSLNLAVEDSTPEEEGYGIDGYVGGVPVSVKPADFESAGMRRTAVFGVLVQYEFEGDEIRVWYDKDSFEAFRKKFS